MSRPWPCRRDSAGARDRRPDVKGGPPSEPGGPPFTAYGRYFFFAPRFSRTRTEMWIGVPSKPNSSRSRRSMKRR